MINDVIIKNIYEKYKKIIGKIDDQSIIHHHHHRHMLISPHHHHHRIMFLFFCTLQPQPTLQGRLISTPFRIQTPFKLSRSQFSFLNLIGIELHKHKSIDHQSIDWLIWLNHHCVIIIITHRHFCSFPQTHSPLGKTLRT